LEDISERIEYSKKKFGELLIEQLKRIEKIKREQDWIDYSKVKPIIIGILGGDGIGPEICKHATTILKFLLKDEINNGNIEIREIEGLTIEKRAAEMKPIPEEVLREIKKCHVILKGPTTTPRKGDPWPNIESANVAIRKELDLFANIRPVKVPQLGIDWMFFRENTEDLYALGSNGIDVTEDLAVDFKIITTPGSERIIRMAFEYAKRNNINRVTVITKANVIKTTDGKFLSVAERISKEYPNIKWDDWYIDIMTAKLIDPQRQKDFRVIVAPNLYGDIITDEAAQIQGGVGTAGSANIGKRYAMFEALHGSALRMVEEGRVKYADPSSMIKAASMLLNHIGFIDSSRKLDMALDICSTFEKNIIITGRSNGATSEEFANYILQTLQNPNLEQKWKNYIKTI